MHVWKKIGIAAGLTAAAAVTIAVATPAYGDTAAQSGDAVGVGSDTLQNAADFVFDGAPGVAGAFNTFASTARVDNVFATGDANGRAVYDGTCGTVNSVTGVGSLCSSSNAGAPNSLIGSVVLRAGTKPVLRPNGSGQGVAALIADSSSPGYKGLPVGSIQFARMSRLPNTGEIQSCDAVSACLGLRVFRAATDNLGIARVTSGFDGPAGLSAQELYNIYTCNANYTTWNQLPGNSAGSTATIHPLLPQTGSGTRNFFLADLAAANNVSSVTPGLCVRTVEEHDPTGIYGDPSPADAIEPFSQGKLNLINTGYFANGVSYSGTNADSADTAGAYTPNYLTLEGGTPGDGNANYVSTRGLYFVVRQTDANSTTPFEAGSTLNFVQALFNSPNSAIESAVGQSQIKAAGFAPSYKDCGADPTPAEC